MIHNTCKATLIIPHPSYRKREDTIIVFFNYLPEYESRATVLKNAVPRIKKVVSLEDVTSTHLPR